jgi:Fe2+ transport system protein FeoA
MTLDKLKTGKSARIISVSGAGRLRDRLLDMGLTPNTKVMVRRTAPLGDPIELTLRGYELTLRLEEASKIEITDVEGE